MSVTASALREIHRIHRHITDLRGRLDRGPRQVKATEFDLQALEAKCVAEKETLKQTRMAADSKQLQLRQREDRIKDLQAKLNGCSSNREYQSFKEQIAADEQANSVLSDEILEMLEKIDEQHAAVALHEGERQKIAEALEALKKKVDQEQAALNAEMDRIMGALQQAESSLPAEIKADYLRISRSRGEDTLAQVNAEVCSGCCQMLSPQTMNVLMMGRPVFCSSCGALLYMPEDTSPAD